ncbi:unnamed protein product [Enterobius vermicularis]|uniref:Exosome complex component RRP46 n=1 Tax=Enterobius vermicularis TaxID=51028 RepID=A0A0N4VFR7_ENTVE|nr:unnamed protein product [Enterobius vermicularis]
MECTVQDVELSSILRGSKYTILLKDEVSTSERLDEVILEILGCNSRRLLSGTMIQGLGVVLTTNGNRSFMEIGLPEEPQITLGKIYGPNRALLYTIMSCLSALSRCCLCKKGDQELSYYSLDRKSQVGRTAQGICKKGKNVIVYFRPTASTEERLALLGTSILFVIEVLYPQYAEWVRLNETNQS